MNALKTIPKKFPKVQRVVNSRKSTAIEITNKDVKAVEKNPEECVVARACIRSFKLDGAIVLPTTTFLVKGETAVRYTNPRTIEREITAFDRGASFEPGKYRLSRSNYSNSTEARRRRRGKTEKPGGVVKKSRGLLKRHVMTNVRTVKDIR